MAALPTDVKVLVIGAGAMGSGIAQVAAMAGHTVYLHDARADAADKGRAGIVAALDKLAARGRMTAEAAQAAAARVRPVAELAAARDAGLVVEAIVEDLDVKRALFVELENLLGATAILASNTSSLSITALAAPLARPERVAGLHFFNPAPVMKLVEVVSGLATAPAVAESSMPPRVPGARWPCMRNPRRASSSTAWRARTTPRLCACSAKAGRM